MKTNGAIPGVSGEKSRVIFREAATLSKPEAESLLPDANGRKLPDFQNEPIIPAKPEVAPSPPVVDAELEDDDLRMTFAVTVQGRTRKIVGAKFDRVLPDGARSQNRHLFFKTLESLLDEMRQTIAIRTNSKLPIEPFTKDGNKNWDGKDFVASDPGPIPQSLTIHSDPPVE